VRFNLQESDNDGQRGSRRKAGAQDLSTATSGSSDSPTRPTRDSKSSAERRNQDSELKQNTSSDSNRSRATAHDDDVHDAVLRHKSTTGLYPSRTVTKYRADSPEADVDRSINDMNPQVPERDSTDVSAGIDTFVSHRWDKTEIPAKRIKKSRILTNVTSMGNVFTATDENLRNSAVDSVESELDASLEQDSSTKVNDEVAPESYNQAVQDPEWRKSMMSEIRA